MLLLNKEGPINKAKVRKIIIEMSDTPNADIEFDVGYEDSGGEFVSIGVDHIHLEDKDAEIKDEEIISAKKTDYTDFKKEFEAAKDPLVLAEKILDSKKLTTKLIR